MIPDNCKHLQLWFTIERRAKSKVIKFWVYTIISLHDCHKLLIQSGHISKCWNRWGSTAHWIGQMEEPLWNIAYLIELQSRPGSVGSINDVLVPTPSSPKKTRYTLSTFTVKPSAESRTILWNIFFLKKCPYKVYSSICIAFSLSVTKFEYPLKAQLELRPIRLPDKNYWLFSVIDKYVNHLRKALAQQFKRWLLWACAQNSFGQHGRALAYSATRQIVSFAFARLCLDFFALFLLSFTANASSQTAGRGRICPSTQRANRVQN